MSSLFVPINVKIMLSTAIEYDMHLPLLPPPSSPALQTPGNFGKSGGDIIGTQKAISEFVFNDDSNQRVYTKAKVILQVQRKNK